VCGAESLAESLTPFIPLNLQNVVRSSIAVAFSELRITREIHWKFFSPSR
jgi:hypothetical protein